MAFAPLQNDLFLRALRGEVTERSPAWLMRQAGRYLPEYNATRAKAGDFMRLCKTPELACEVTLQPIDRYPLDAAILFSDILTIPDALGLGLHFVQGEGPRFARAIEHEADVAALPTIDVEESLGYVAQAVTTIRHALGGRVPLIGFSGSPWTLACYMVTGGSSGDDFLKARNWVYQRPDLMLSLIGRLEALVIDYCTMQIRAGAQAIQLFDSWGGLLAHGSFERFSLASLRRITAALQNAHPDVPVIVFVKGGGGWLERIASTRAQALGLDWSVPLSEAATRLGPGMCLQGNLDPAVLLSRPEAIEAEVRRLFEDLRGFNETAHVFNLGHGISQFTPPEHVAVLLEAVAQASQRRSLPQTTHPR